MSNQEILLQKVGKLIEEQNEKSKKNGEQFNIFQITGKQSAEQHTHSAFIAELLNPNGKHEMGDIFLKLFLNILNEKIDNEESFEDCDDKIKRGPNSREKFKSFYKSENFNESIFLNNTEVIVEKHIGVIEPKPQEVGDLNAIGGNIDILLILNGNYLTIENKIDAPDQLNQVIRYRNYKRDNNIVFFLTLDGKEPDNISKGSLESGIDFYCVSYEDQIVEWLKKCIEVKDLKPNIKLSINQYKVLILKLTNQMENQTDFNQEIYRYHDSAKMIYKKYNRAMESLRNDFRNRVYDTLKKKLKYYTIEKKSPKKHSMIFIKHKDLKNSEIFFAVGVFSDTNYPNMGNKLFGGIRINNGNEAEAKLINVEFRIGYWPINEELYNEELTNEYLIKLENDDNERDKVVGEIVEKMSAFIEIHENKVKN